MAKTVKYQIGSTEIYKISRSRIEEHLRCAHCSVLYHREGLRPVSSPPFNINSKVDAVLKKEFDHYRELQQVPPLLEKWGLDLVPFKHEKMNEWRENFKGVRFTTEHFLVTGAVDDIWVNRDGQLILVDYKATGKTEAVTELGDGDFHQGYRRQMEIYQWLLRKNGFDVSPTGYWLYVTATGEQDFFEGTLHFEQNLVSHEGDTSWIEGVLDQMKRDLDNPTVPDSSPTCDSCRYFKQRSEMESHASGD